jgi:hypothetical protein
MANPKRPRGTGKGTRNAWQNTGGGIESGPPAGLPVADNQEGRRGKIDQGMHGEGPVEEYDAQPRGVSELPDLAQRLESSTSERGKATINKKIQKIIKAIPSVETPSTFTRRTGPTRETAARKPIAVEKKEGPDLSAEERKGLNNYIESILLQYDFGKCLNEERYGATEEDNKEIKNLLKEDMVKAVEYLASYLVGEYGIESIKKSISDKKFPEVEYFENKLHKLAKCYYHIFLQKIDNPNRGQLDDLTRLDLEEYPNEVLEGVSETLSRAVNEKELGLKIEFEDAVDAKIKEILQKIGGMRHKLQKSGVDLDMLDKEIQEIREKGRVKIIKHCLIAFSPEGKEKGWENHEDQIAFWANYFTESAFKHLGGDDLRKAYFKAFPRQFDKVKKDEPARVISRPEEGEGMTIEKILVSEELRKIYVTIETYLLGELQKIREASGQKRGLQRDERVILEGVLRDEYKERFVPGGSEDSEEAEQMFVNSIIQSIEKKLKRK